MYILSQWHKNNEPFTHQPESEPSISRDLNFLEMFSKVQTV